MKAAVKLLILTIFAAIPSMAQEAYGYLNLVNMVPGNKACDILIDSKNPSGEGLKSADDTGWFLFPIGTHSITIGMDGLKEQKGTLEIKEGEGTLIAIFLQADPKLDKDGKPSPPLLRIKKLPTIATEGLSLHLVSLCPLDKRFQLGASHIEVEQFKVIDIPNWTGAGFKIRRNGNDIAEIPNRREKEPYYLLVADDLEGKYTAALVFGGMPNVPPWRMKKEPENKEEKP